MGVEGVQGFRGLGLSDFSAFEVNSYRVQDFGVEDVLPPKHAAVRTLPVVPPVWGEGLAGSGQGLGMDASETHEYFSKIGSL